MCPFSGDARACLCGGEFYLCELVSVLCLKMNIVVPENE